MFNKAYVALQEKWSPIIEHTDMPKIEDSYKRRVTAILLENQEISKNMGNEGAKFIEEQFNWNLVTKRFLELIRPHVDIK